MPDIDLLIEGGLVVSSKGSRQVNVAINAGRIVSVGSSRPSARETVDAGGLLVMPGAIDTHVHLMDPADTTREDFPSGTAAAAASGVTTILEHSHGRPVRTVDDLREKVDYLRDRANVDYGLAAHAWPGHAHQVAPLWAEGVSFFKVFTCTTHGVAGHDAAALRTHLEATAAVDARSLMHCEDESITESAESLLRNEGRADPSSIIEWRNRDAELAATAVAALLVRRTGAHATVAHVSNQEAASYIAAERLRGASIWAEACPQYFLLREGEVHGHGTLRKFTPPARARTDDDETQMWRLLREGTLTHMSSDHAPSTLQQKSDGDIWNAHFGLPGLDTTMLALLDAAARGLLAYEDVVRTYSENPAKIYGFWPGKGQIAAGAQADVILVDPRAKQTLRNERVLSKARWTPYDGRTITGQVVRTYLRGRLTAEDGRIVGDLSGEFLRGRGYQPK